MEGARGRPGKPVIAIPCEPAAKAGAQVLRFKSVTDAGKFFGCDKGHISRCIRKNKGNHPYQGFFMDYLKEEDD